jgi:hypothetical protein
MGRSARALALHDALAPLTKKVSRVPVSRQNRAKAATTSESAPSSTVSATRRPTGGRRVNSPSGTAARLLPIG